MNHRTFLQRLLKKNNFKLIRSSKHLIYRNADNNTIIVPHHSRMNEYTFRELTKQIKRAG